MTSDALIIGIGELGASAASGRIIRTLGLGSCVAVIIVDTVRRVSGMAHVVLPKSEKGEIDNKPTAYYADLAIPALLARMAKFGSGPRNGPLAVKVIGGANRSADTRFNIGKRNLLAVKRSLYASGLSSSAEDVGGGVSRTVTIRVGDPTVHITSPEREDINL